jgi:hypothetical protein
LTPDQKPDDVLWHQSGVNEKGEPFVQLLRGMHILGQMSVEQAREHGHAILEAAEAAEQDAFLLDLLQTKVGLDFNTAGNVLADFRRYRMERSGKRGGPSNPNDWVFPDGK